MDSMWRGKTKSPQATNRHLILWRLLFFSALLDAQRNTGMHGQKKTKLILIQCACCRKWQVVLVDPDDLERHANGMFVQFAFTKRDGTTYLTPAERELFISACCGSCWDLLCADPIAHPTAYN